MTRLLITGAAGYLGRRLVHIAAGQWAGTQLLPRPTNAWSVIGTYNQTPPPHAPNAQFLQIDLTTPEQVEDTLDRLRPDAVIHTAGSNQSEKEMAAIEPMTHILATQCAWRNIRLVHVSTDMVFGGDQAPYADEDPPAPVHRYGEIKAQAETILRENHPSAVFARPSLIFNLQPPDYQTNWLLEGLHTAKPIRLFTDEWRCPIWVDNLALALLELASIEYAGPLNLTGPHCLNRWEFGLKLLTALNLKPSKNIQPSTIADSGLVRPANLTLDTSRARMLLKTPLLSVDEAIEEISKETP